MADQSPVINEAWRSKAGSNKSSRHSPMGQENHTTGFTQIHAAYDDVTSNGLGSSIIDGFRSHAAEIISRAPLHVTRFERPPTAGSEPGFTFAPAPVAQLNQSRSVGTSQISNLQNSGQYVILLFLIHLYQLTTL